LGPDNGHDGCADAGWLEILDEVLARSETYDLRGKLLHRPRKRARRAHQRQIDGREAGYPQCLLIHSLDDSPLQTLTAEEAGPREQERPEEADPESAGEDGALHHGWADQRAAVDLGGLDAPVGDSFSRGEAATCRRSRVERRRRQVKAVDRV